MNFVAVIDVGKIWYGGSAKVLVSMVDRARELGADPVIEVKTWHQPSGFSWAASHGSGKAVKFKNKASIDFSKLHGLDVSHIFICARSETRPLEE